MSGHSCQSTARECIYIVHGSYTWLCFVLQSGTHLLSYQCLQICSILQKVNVSIHKVSSEHMYTESIHSCRDKHATN